MKKLIKSLTLLFVASMFIFTGTITTFANTMVESEIKYKTEYTRSVTDENGLTWEITETGTRGTVYVETVVDEYGEEWIIEWSKKNIESYQDPQARVLRLVRGVYDYKVRSPRTGATAGFIVTVEFGDTSSWWNQDCTYIYCSQYEYADVVPYNVGRSYGEGRCEFWYYTSATGSNIAKIVGYRYQLNTAGDAIVVSQY